MPADPKDVLRSYLQGARDTLVWKLEGLSERELRQPRTPTGLNLLGIVKHALNGEAVYFGPVFGRTWPTPQELADPDDGLLRTSSSLPPDVDWPEHVARLAALAERS